MSVDGIAAVAVASGNSVHRAEPASAAPIGFERWMTSQLSEVNQRIGIAERALTGLAAGEGSLHEVMLELEMARTAFQLTVEVRNKLIESYQEIMRMQV